MITSHNNWAPQLMTMDLKHWFSSNHKGAFNHWQHRRLNQLKHVMSFEGREQQQCTTVKTFSHDVLSSRSSSCSMVFRRLASLPACCWISVVYSYFQDVNGAAHDSTACLRIMPDTWRLPTCVQFHSSAQAKLLKHSLSMQGPQCLYTTPDLCVSLYRDRTAGL